MDAKSILKSKIVWFNLLVLVVGVASLFGFAEHVPGAEAQANIDVVVVFVAALAPLVNMGLRLITDQPVHIMKK